MHFRQLLPPGKERSGIAAADGQMGQIMHALSGLDALRRYGMAARHLAARSRRRSSSPGCPAAGMPIATACMEGVQHNTYDVEFYGPNPLCGV